MLELQEVVALESHRSLGNLGAGHVVAHDCKRNTFVGALFLKLLDFSIDIRL